jgi:hypothetical protein
MRAGALLLAAAVAWSAPAAHAPTAHAQESTALCDQLAEGVRRAVAAAPDDLDLNRITAALPELRLEGPVAQRVGRDGAVDLAARKLLSAEEIAAIERSTLLDTLEDATMSVLGSAPEYLVIENVAGTGRYQRLAYFARTAAGLIALPQPGGTAPPNFDEYCQSCGEYATPVIIAGVPSVVTTALRRPQTGHPGGLTFVLSVHRIGGPRVCALSARLAYRLVRKEPFGPPCDRPACDIFETVERAIAHYDATRTWPTDFGTDPAAALARLPRPDDRAVLDWAEFDPGSWPARFSGDAVLRYLERGGGRYLVRVGGAEFGQVDLSGFIAALFQIVDGTLQRRGAIRIDRVPTAVIDMQVSR